MQIDHINFMSCANNLISGAYINCPKNNNNTVAWMSLKNKYTITYS